MPYGYFNLQPPPRPARSTYGYFGLFGKPKAEPPRKSLPDLVSSQGLEVQLQLSAVDLQQAPWVQELSQPQPDHFEALKIWLRRDWAWTRLRHRERMLRLDQFFSQLFARVF